MNSFGTSPRRFAAVLVLLVSALGGAGAALLGVCGPFTDVSDAAFCPFVLEIFTLGITTGTTPTTYDPTTSVSRLQMAAFLSRTVDGVLRRGSRRAALDQYWTTQNSTVLGLTTIGVFTPFLVQSDGADVWVPVVNGLVCRVRASDGKLLETWTGATSATGVAVAMGRVFVAGSVNPGRLYQIDPSQPAGSVTTVASNIGSNPFGLAFDGSRFWTANQGDGSVSIVTPGASIPWTVTTVPVISGSDGALFDGSNIWITFSVGGIRKLDSNGAVLQTVTVGSNPVHPTFDGANIWVPNFGSNSVSVVRASTGAVLATLTGNGVSTPVGAAFDGQRVLITNQNADTVSLFKAADLTPLGSFSTGTGTEPFGVCSNGIHFWITLQLTSQLARF
jgi:hypothetical protein